MSEKFIISLILHYSAMFGVAPNLALAVAKTESGLDPQKIGEAGEVGVFQLMRSSFPKVKNLDNVEVNIREGIKYLAWNKKYCKHQRNDSWVICYNFGIENAKKVKYPEKFPYYLRVKQVMREL
jgi:soluble lytic murein transglycosylase-like protein